MKRILAAALLLVGTLGYAIGQTRVDRPANNAETERELMRLDREWSEAVPREDITTLKRILADNYTFTTIVGNVITKAQYMERSEDSHVLSLKTDSVKVRVYDGAAVVTGRIAVELLNRTDHARYINVYARLRGQWQLVATQFTRIADR